MTREYSTCYSGVMADTDRLQDEVQYWINRALDAEDRADVAILEREDARAHSVSLEDELSATAARSWSDDEADTLYDNYLGELTRNDDLAEEVERATLAYESLINFIVLLEPEIREIMADTADLAKEPALKDKFEEFAHELHRSLIARTG